MILLCAFTAIAFLLFCISAIEEDNEKFAGSPFGKLIVSLITLLGVYAAVYVTSPFADVIDESTKVSEHRRKVEWFKNFETGSPYENVAAYTVEFTDGSSTKRVVAAGQRFYIEVKN